MEMDRAVGVLVALRRCTLDEASDELLDAAKRHRLPPLTVARALVALAEDCGGDDPATAAVRYEWGLLFESQVVSQ
jgi:ANTAR domain